MNAAAGKLITFEGTEGVGKSTQIELAAAWLTRERIAHVVTREPGGTPLAEKVRKLVLEAQSESLPPVAELLLMFAARSVHLANLIEPALREGKLVLCDRFTDATFAYQGAGRGVPTAAIAALEELVQTGRQPDLTLLLDLPAADGLRRAAARARGPDRFEAQTVSFFERVREAYLQRARAAPERFVIIDAGADIETVRTRVAAAIRDCVQT